jgi:rhodanese-related sulfurtransferase
VVTRSADDLVTQARERIQRVSPMQAFERVAQGALLVDIRPAAQREAHGGVREAVIIERNVLEWRLDPSGSWRIPEVTDHERQVLVLCQEGYASSLAAASLAALGYRNVGDVIGGFAAWQAAGLPTLEPAKCTHGTL